MNKSLEKVFNIGDLVIVESTNPFLDLEMSTFNNYAIIIGVKRANEASSLKYFYKLHFCGEDKPEDKWVFSDELALLSKFHEKQLDIAKEIK